jgi:exopolyphosphatase/guanosine-5'-triphosphate,3'-diphosphate pyrophosphatase
MGEIIPRWEWRTFGEAFGQAEEKIKVSGEPNTRESAEIYIISRKSHDNTKIRHQLMDIKTLRKVNDNKLEQWYPLMKSGFPLSKSELAKVVVSWAIEMPAVGDPVPYDTFLQEVVGANPVLKAVPVTKVRHGYTIEGTTVELADLMIADTPIRTLCVEHADPELVWRVINDLGLGGHENVNYVTAIKRIIGWQ